MLGASESYAGHIPCAVQLEIVFVVETARDAAIARWRQHQYQQG